MSKNDLDFLNIFSDFYNIFFAYKANIVVLSGDFGTTICVFKNKKIIDYVFVSKKNNIILQDFDFIKKYKGYYIFFLINDEKQKLYHESLPVIQNILKTSPVKQFLENNTSPENTIVYEVLAISKKEIETWFTVFSSIPLQNNLQDLIKYSIDSGLEFGGLYHFQLQAFYIIDKILSTQQIVTKVLPNQLQIFITPTRSFGVFIAVRNNNHIIYSRSEEYPEGRSKEYLQGVIENQINNCLSYLKPYITMNKLEVTCSLLVGDDLQENFKNHDSRINQYTIIPISSIYSSFPNLIVYEKDFSDILIAGLLNLCKKHLAFNQNLIAISRLTWIGHLLSKLFQLSIIIMIFKIISGSYMIFSNESKINSLNKETILLTNKYNDLKLQYPQKVNFSKILDYYTLNRIIESQKAITPNNIIQAIINNPNSTNAIIKQVTWSNDDNVYATVELSYVLSNVTISKFFNDLRTYIDKLKSNLPDYFITYNIDKQQLLKISGISSIDLTIKLKKINE